jgi:hypothetical protein
MGLNCVSVYLPLSRSVNHSFARDYRYSERRWGVHPPVSPGLADFTIMKEFTPESGHCHSVHSTLRAMLQLGTACG